MIRNQIPTAKDTVYVTGESRIHADSAVMAVGQAQGYSDTRYYYLADHLGSVRVVLTETGNVDSWSDYYPFGKESRGSSTSNEPKEQFTGKKRDIEIGLDYFGARYYNAEIGRWNRVDPKSESRPSLSSYNYCSNNPIKRFDPNGELDGDYYSMSGAHLGSDGKKDDKVYIVAGSSTSNKKGHSFSSEIGDGTNATELTMTHTEFLDLAGTLYAEGSSTWDEAAGIYSVMENRASSKGVTTYDIASSGEVYGWNEKDKINSPLANQDMVQNAFKGLVAGITESKDYSGGGFYWHGKDFGLSNWKTNKDYYQTGFKFSNSSHDIWSQGDRKSGQSGYDYKYQSTGASGNTTFMKLTDEWVKHNNHGGSW